jgi:hypothetical protein
MTIPDQSLNVLPQHPYGNYCCFQQGCWQKFCWKQERRRWPNLIETELLPNGEKKRKLSKTPSFILVDSVEDGADQNLDKEKRGAAPEPAPKAEPAKQAKPAADK